MERTHCCLQDPPLSEVGDEAAAVLRDLGLMDEMQLWSSGSLCSDSLSDGGGSTTSGCSQQPSHKASSAHVHRAPSGHVVLGQGGRPELRREVRARGYGEGHPGAKSHSSPAHCSLLATHCHTLLPYQHAAHSWQGLSHTASLRPLHSPGVRPARDGPPCLTDRETEAQRET